MTENDIASVVVDAALKIHKTLGPVCWNRFTRQRLVSSYKKEAYE